MILLMSLFYVSVSRRCVASSPVNSLPSPFSPSRLSFLFVIFRESHQFPFLYIHIHKSFPRQGYPVYSFSIKVPKLLIHPPNPFQTIKTLSSSITKHVIYIGKYQNYFSTPSNPLLQRTIQERLLNPRSNFWRFWMESISRIYT